MAGSAPRSGTCLWKVFPARKALGAGARSRVLQKSSAEGEWHVRGAWHQAEAPLQDKPPYTAPAGRSELPNTSSVRGGTSRPFPPHPKHVDGPQRLGEGSVVLVSPPQAPSQEQTQRLSPRTKSQRGFGVQQLTSSSCPGPTQDLHMLALPLHPLQTVWPWGFGTAAPRLLCPSAERTGRCSGVPARAHRGDVLGENPAPEVQLTLQKDPQVE